MTSLNGPESPFHLDASVLGGITKIDDYVEAIVAQFAASDLARRHMRLTDIMLDPNQPPVLIVNARPLRTDGPRITPALLDSAREYLSPQARRDFDDTMDAPGRFSLADGATIRMHLFKANRGTCAMLRLQPPQPYTWAEMQLPDDLLEALDRPQGLILFSGEVGSRKTASAHAMLDYANSRYERPRHIITIEDPPEFEHVNRAAFFHSREIGFTCQDYLTAIYGSGLRALPNIILLGELRDAATIEAGMMAASLGRLVIATAHSKTTHQTIGRLTKPFTSEKRAEILSTLKDVLVVIVTLCPVQGVGGAIHLAYEILWIDDATRNILDQPDQLRGALAINERCVPLERTLSDLVSQALISREEALRHAHSPRDLTA